MLLCIWWKWAPLKTITESLWCICVHLSMQQPLADLKVLVQWFSCWVAWHISRWFTTQLPVLWWGIICYSSSNCTSCWLQLPAGFCDQQNSEDSEKKSISVVWVLLLYIRLNWLWFVDCLGILITVDKLQEKKKKKQQHTKYSGNIRTERSRPRRDFFDHNEFRVVHSDWINKKPRFEIYNSEYSNASKEQLQIQH